MLYCLRLQKAKKDLRTQRARSVLGQILNLGWECFQCKDNIGVEAISTFPVLIGPTDDCSS